MLNEISLKRKVLHDKNFPNQELIKEFLNKKDLIPSKLDIGWKQPQVYQFIVNILLHIYYKIVFLLNVLLNIYNLFCIRILWRNIYVGNHNMHLKKYSH